jgi:mono/diheme cytochrome c family protein
MPNEPDAIPDAERRERADPSERSRPIPLIVAAVALAAVLFGTGYILNTESFGRADLGDRRTLADLAGPVAPAGGAVNGKQLFATHCVACHQATGKGLPGVFPPLDGSEWVVGDERTVVNILLHGISGELVVAGNTYQGEMPAFRQLSDAELAALASHVRAEWSNKAGAIKQELFAQERKDGTRSKPFAGGAELKTLAKAP